MVEGLIIPSRMFIENTVKSLEDTITVAGHVYNVGEGIISHTAPSGSSVSKIRTFKVSPQNGFDFQLTYEYKQVKCLPQEKKKAKWLDKSIPNKKTYKSKPSSLLSSMIKKK